MTNINLLIIIWKSLGGQLEVWDRWIYWMLFLKSFAAKWFNYIKSVVSFQWVYNLKEKRAMSDVNI